MNLTVIAYDLTATADVQTRTIVGVAVPYNAHGRPGGAFAGSAVSFRHGSLTRSLTERASKVRLIVDHDQTRVVGRLTDYTDSPNGLLTEWKIARTPGGDAVLAEAADGIRDGLSVGVDVLDYERTRDGIEVVEARFVECSLVAFPAYDTARVERVAANEDPAPRGIDPRIIRYRMNLRGPA